MTVWQTKDMQQVRKTIVVLAALGFLYCLYLISRPFLLSTAWAIVITISFWPWHLRIMRLLRGHAGAAALVSTLCVGVIILGIVIPLSSKLADEGRAVIIELSAYVSSQQFRDMLHHPNIDRW